MRNTTKTFILALAGALSLAVGVVLLVLLAPTSADADDYGADELRIECTYANVITQCDVFIVEKLPEGELPFDERFNGADHRCARVGERQVWCVILDGTPAPTSTPTPLPTPTPTAVPTPTPAVVVEVNPCTNGLTLQRHEVLGLICLPSPGVAAALPHISERPSPWFTG